MALTIDTNCSFHQEGGYFEKRFIFFGPEEWVPETFAFEVSYRSDIYRWPEKASKEEFERLSLRQQHIPVHLINVGPRHWWWFEDDFYHTNDNYSDPLVFKGLLLEKKERLRRKKERARAAANGEPPPPRSRSNKSGKAPRNPPSPSKQCPYQTLGLTQNASLAEIKAAYRKQVTQYHPDKVAALGPALRNLAEEMTKQINEAYVELSKIRAS